MSAVPSGAVHAARVTAASGAQRPAEASGGPSDGGATAAPDGPVPTAQLQGQADRCYAQEWTAEEQRALETGLLKWPADRTPPLERYLRIAATLAAKGVRDVALRVRWMGRFAQQKRRVSVVYNDPDTNRAPQRQRQGHTGSIFAQTPVQPAPAVSNGVTQPPASLPVANPYQIPANMLVMPSMMPDGTMIGSMAPGVMPGAMGSLPMPMQTLQPYGGLMPGGMPPMPAPTPPTMTLDDHGSGGVGGVGGPIATLLSHNYSILDSFKQNMQTWRVGENTELLMTFRDNILSILNHMQNMGGVMSDMPALPVRMNVELANNFLPRGPPGLGGMPPFTLSMQMPTMGMFPNGIPGMAASMPAAIATPAAAAVTGAPAASQQPAAGVAMAGLPVPLPVITDTSVSGDNAASGQLAAAVSAITAALPASAAQGPTVAQQQQPQEQQRACQVFDSPPTAVASSSPVVTSQASPAGGIGASPPATTSAPQPRAATAAGAATPAAGSAPAATAATPITPAAELAACAAPAAASVAPAWPRPPQPVPAAAAAGLLPTSAPMPAAATAQQPHNNLRQPPAPGVTQVKREAAAAGATGAVPVQAAVKQQIT